MSAQNYRDKLVFKSEIGTPEHDEMCFSITKKKVLGFLKVVCPDGTRRFVRNDYFTLFFPTIRIPCKICGGEHFVKSSFYREEKYEICLDEKENPSAKVSIFKEEYTQLEDGSCFEEIKKKFFEYHAKDFKSLREQLDASLTFLEEDVEIEFEHPCMSYSQYPIAIIDVVATAHKEEMQDKEVSLLIEIKPQISSFGDILRQIKIYQQYYKSDKSRYVFPILYYKRCENQKALEVIKEQGITPIKYKTDEEIKQATL